MNVVGALEGLLFIVGDEGLTLDQITEILEIDEQQAKEVLMELRKNYEEENRGIRVHFLGNTFKLTTKETNKEYYKKLVETGINRTLSQAALETLAIIAYNEPVTRVKIDEVRGVSSGHIIRKLLARDFIKEVGKADQPGHPILYKTTNTFLDYFGLASTNDLPQLEPVERTEEDVELFYKKQTEKQD